MVESPQNQLRPEEAELPTGIRDRVRFNDAGLVPAIVQAAGTGEVLMMAWMDDLSLIHI